MKLDLLAIGSHPDDVELCCGGTVANMVPPSGRLRPRRSAIRSAVDASRPMDFSWATGSPVLPDVKAIATTCWLGRRVACRGLGWFSTGRRCRTTGRVSLNRNCCLRLRYY